MSDQNPKDYKVALLSEMNDKFQDYVVVPFFKGEKLDFVQNLVVEVSKYEPATITTVRILDGNNYFECRGMRLLSTPYDNLAENSVDIVVKINSDGGPTPEIYKNGVLLTDAQRVVLKACAIVEDYQVDDMGNHIRVDVHRLSDTNINYVESYGKKYELHVVHRKRPAFNVELSDQEFMVFLIDAMLERDCTDESIMAAIKDLSEPLNVDANTIKEMIEKARADKPGVQSTIITEVIVEM